jgi:hypothetical protein
LAVWVAAFGMADEEEDPIFEEKMKILEECRR